MTNARALASILFACALLLPGCASIDFDQPKPRSIAVAPDVTADTRLGQAFAPLIAEHSDRSGFLLVYDGIDALAIRLALAERAEQSIDAQYYLIHDDLTGHLFAQALLDAADRGVRVRLLIDDIHTKGRDVGLAAFDSHPNIEVRLFNPFARRSRRGLDGLTSFSRINRRMHNKSFTVDNQVSVVGGRNIGAEYFGAGGKFDFSDLDVACIGPVAAEISTLFDAYWNSPPSMPITALASAPARPDEALADVRDRIAAARDEVKGTDYAAAVQKSFSDLMQLDTEAITWAKYYLVYDPPEKAQPEVESDTSTIRSQLISAFDAAEESAVIVSPYFVPRKSGVARFQELVDRGVDVTVVTNSLASTDNAIVHGGYTPSRKPLLRMGVQLAEYRAYPDTLDGQARGGDDKKLSLHTKAFVIDSERLFVGSFNFDPRSARINTEMGVIIDSPEMAAAAVARVREAMPTRSYVVNLDENGSLRWLGHDSEGPVIEKREPQAGKWRRFMASFSRRLLPIRGQL